MLGPIIHNQMTALLELHHHRLVRTIIFAQPLAQPIAIVYDDKPHV
jgi:hypothetical protein